MGNQQANLKRKSEEIRDVLKSVNFDDEVIEILEFSPDVKKPRLPYQDENEVVDLTKFHIVPPITETLMVLSDDDGEIGNIVAKQSQPQKSPNHQLLETNDASTCVASSSSFQQPSLKNSVESLMEKIMKLVISADPTTKTEKILRGLQNSFKKLKPDFRDSKDFHKMLLDVCDDMEKKDVFGCLKVLFKELKLHRDEKIEEQATTDENIKNEAKTDDPECSLKKSLVKHAEKEFEKLKTVIKDWEKCEKIRFTIKPSEIEDLPILDKQFKTGFAAFDFYLLQKVENGQQISYEKILKQLKILNQSYGYNLDNGEEMEICEIVLKKFSDHEKRFRARVYEIHRKQETNIALEDPAEQNEQLKKKLAENAIQHAKKFRRMLRQRKKNIEKFELNKQETPQADILIKTEDKKEEIVKPKAENPDETTIAISQHAIDIAARSADPEAFEQGISDTVVDQAVSIPDEEIQNEPLNMSQKYDN